MSNIDKALATQITNIQSRTGKSLMELMALIRQSGFVKHGEIRDMLKKDLGLGHGDANTLTHLYRDQESAGQNDTPESGTSAQPQAVSPLEALYTGKKAALRAIHERLMTLLEPWGDFEQAPKKSYISLRRKKQFATIGPATQSRIDIGLNMKGVEPTQRLQALPSGGMCTYKVAISSMAEIDDELLGWIRTAYESAS